MSLEAPLVMIVEDTLDAATLMQISLRRAGIQDILHAENGRMALDYLEMYTPDVLILDIGMPDMNGWELATAIRRRSETIALAIVSGWADAISCDTRNVVKADWVVSKPFDINRISEIAHEINERKKLVAFPNAQNVDTVDRRRS